MYKYLNKYQSYILINKYCKKCRIYKSFMDSGRVSFMLSGYTTTERQWKNIEKFSKIIKV